MDGERSYLETSEEGPSNGASYLETPPSADDVAVESAVENDPTITPDAPPIGDENGTSAIVGYALVAFDAAEDVQAFCFAVHDVFKSEAQAREACALDGEFVCALVRLGPMLITATYTDEKKAKDGIGNA